eukprot:TRINITY_DN4189_c0_g3_i1.p1 TRINITY_DN4189_c0_g3~~TRINITY_DN4189_c0_g3_i1.p1  ORF type:complete len:761 (+),score=98.79 TRINITY_DN4189_c0_g3_i1:100-2382(+)
MPRQKDPVWEEVAELDNKNVKCKHCSFVFQGTATKITQHLEGGSGQIRGCPSTPPAVRLRLQRRRESSQVEVEARARMASAETGESSRQSVGVAPSGGEEMSNRSAERSRLALPVRPTTIPEWYKAEKKLSTDAAYLRMVLVDRLAFRLSQSPWARAFFVELADHGPGWEPPTEYQQKVPLLNEELNRIDEKLVVLKQGLSRYGCTLICDGWTDKSDNALLNFIAVNHLGSFFLFTINAGATKKTGEFIRDGLKRAMLEVGQENIVHIVMDNAGANRLASRMLIDEFPKLYYTNCAAHCLDLLLEDIGKERWVAKNISLANAIVKYVKNKTWVRVLFQSKSNGKTLLKPNKTRFATQWLMLQRLLDRRHAINEMVSAPEWTTRAAGEAAADRALNQRIERIIYDLHFWDRVRAIVTIMLPVYSAIRAVDKAGPTMGSVWTVMDQTKREMREALTTMAVPEDMAQRIMDLVKARTGLEWVLSPLHSVAWLLNPANRLAPMEEREVHRPAFISFVEKMYDDDAKRALIEEQYALYFEGAGPVGRPMGELLRKKVAEGVMHPWTWWENYGYELKPLVYVACRVLAQPSSASDCERNWAAHAAFHTDARNRLTSQLLQKCVYADQNLRLIRESEAPSKKRKRKHALLTVGGGEERPNEALPTEESAEQAYVQAPPPTIEEMVAMAEAEINEEEFDDQDLPAEAIEEEEPEGGNGIPLIDVTREDRAWFEERAIRERFFTVPTAEFTLGDLMNDWNPAPRRSTRQ